MDTTTKIAGDLTVGDWLQLQSQLERNLDEDNLWRQAYAFFETRITNRYLKPIDAIELNSNIEGEGFAIVAIICSLIEALETFRDGKVYKRATKGNPLDDANEYFKSQPIFERFLQNREPFKTYFAADNLASSFYENVRCSVLHEAATRSGWKIRVDTNALVEKRNDSLILNRVLFVKAIKQYMNDYKHELVGSRDLKKAYIQKMMSICRTA